MSSFLLFFFLATSKSTDDHLDKLHIHSQFNIGWYTPYMVFNLSTSENGVHPPSFHKSLTNYALKFYDKFVNNIEMYQAMSEPKNADYSELDMNDILYNATNNDAFFHFQNHMFINGKLFDKNEFPFIDIPIELNIIKNDIKHMAGEFLYAIGLSENYINKIIYKSDEIENLYKNYDESQKINKNTIRYFKQNLQSPESQPKPPTEDEISELSDFQMWATVHSNGSRHSSHDHELAIVSGVYFTKIDNNMGNLILQDPRGIGYPFGLKHIHKPIEGQVVLFPGYLIHEVESTIINNKRVSYAFNFDGEWKDITKKTKYYMNFGDKEYNINKHRVSNDRRNIKVEHSEF